MNKRRLFIAAVILVGLAAVVWAWLHFKAVRTEARIVAARESLYRSMGIQSPGSEFFVPLPPETPHSGGAALLGASLFSDKRLVKSSKRTCAACHPPLNGGADDKIHDGQLTRSTQNAAFASFYLHDGSLMELKDVVAYMISSSGFGAYSVTGAVARLMRDSALASRFAANYETGLVESNVVDSLVQYLRAHVTHAGPFDRHLSGKAGSLNETQLRGFEVFKVSSCSLCHAGPAMGGRAIHGERKVVALRGASKRKRFLSDGSAQDISTALFRMPTADLSEEDRAALVAFLECL